MNRTYEFVVGNDARDFCDEIVREMVRRFNISDAEALGRVNRQWKGNDFKEEDIRYHETAEFWASDIYFGANSAWWNAPAGLTPLPFP